VVAFVQTDISCVVRGQGKRSEVVVVVLVAAG
jgi:hypothetical protein